MSEQDTLHAASEQIETALQSLIKGMLLLRQTDVYTESELRELHRAIDNVEIFAQDVFDMYRLASMVESA